MMDLDTIREFQAEAASIAAKAKQKPMLMETSDVGNIESLRRLPNIGTYLPDGWERVDASTFGDNGRGAGTVDGVPYFFVDKTGWGSKGEPAITVTEMAALIRPGYGYAIVEEGQFQIGIGVFKKL